VKLRRFYISLHPDKILKASGDKRALVEMVVGKGGEKGLKREKVHLEECIEVLQIYLNCMQFCPFALRKKYYKKWRCYPQYGGKNR
jgi:hypothetical protein